MVQTLKTSLLFDLIENYEIFKAAQSRNLP